MLRRQRKFRMMRRQRNIHYFSYFCPLKFPEMKQEINPKETPRAFAFEMWMTAPMPMVTLVKTMNVSNLLRASRKNGVKFNTLMCW